MAIQIEPRGQVQDFLDVLRRRAWQIAVPAVFVIVIGSCLAVVIPRKFLAQTRLELRQTGPSFVSREAQNASVQITAPARIRTIVEDKLRPPAYLALDELDRRAFLKDIDRNVRVVPVVPGSQSSVFLTITYTDVDRVWAGTFLKTLREDWQQDVLEQDKNRLQEEVQRLGNECEKLREKWSKEEEELSTLKRESGLSAMQPIPGAGTVATEDPEYNRLQEHKGELAQLEVELAFLGGQMREYQAQLQKIPPKLTSEQLVPGMTHGEKILEVDTKIAAARRKLEQYKPPHSMYVTLREQIRALELQREDLASSVTAVELARLAVDNPAHAEMRGRIATLVGEIAGQEAKKKSLEATIERESRVVESMHETYREVRLREGRIQLYRADLSAAELRFQAKVQESRIASSPKNNPFAILEEVNVPPKATEPNPWLVVALSVAAGLGLGIGIAVLLEYTKSCFRSVYDVSRVLPVPVLGNINRIVTTVEARQRHARRALVGSASALFLGTLAFITWAWAHDQESGLLTPALRRAIEGLRAALK